MSVREVATGGGRRPDHARWQRRRRGRADPSHGAHARGDHRKIVHHPADPREPPQTRAAAATPLRGGTHQQNSPTFHDLALVWAPAVARLGFRFELALQAAGFYPEGGGEITAAVEPAHPMPPLDLRHRGMLEEVEVVAMVGGLPFAVAERLPGRAPQGGRRPRARAVEG